MIVEVLVEVVVDEVVNERAEEDMVVMIDVKIATEVKITKEVKIVKEVKILKESKRCHWPLNSSVVMFLLSGQLCFRLMSSPSAFPIRYLSFYSLSLSLSSLCLSLSFSSPSAFPIIFPHKLHVFCLKYSDSPSNMTILVDEMMK